MQEQLGILCSLQVIAMVDGTGIYFSVRLCADKHQRTEIRFFRHFTSN
jgi:hypothetical protein